MTQRFLSIKNFEKYQRYTDRLPPWVKLHYTLLEDAAWMTLDEVQQCRYMKLLLVASRCENRISTDQTYLQNMLRLRGNVDLTPLIHAGFLVTFRAKQLQHHGTVGASTMIPPCHILAPNGHAETETETETETEERERPHTQNGVPPTPTVRGKRAIGEEDRPTDKHLDLAKTLGIDPGPEWGKFKNYCLAHDKRYANFEAAFRNWLVRAKEGAYASLHPVRH